MDFFSKLLINPKDGKEMILNMLNKAKHSIRITMYQLTDNDIQNALLDKADKGVDVRVIYDGSVRSDDSKKAIMHEQ